MKGHGEKLTRKQEAAIAALLSHDTVAEAAQSCGIGESTLWRWMQDEGFKEQYREARRQALDQAIGDLQQACGLAVATLKRNLTAASPAVQVKAACAILEFSLRAKEMVELEERLAFIEAQLKTKSLRRI